MPKRKRNRPNAKGRSEGRSGRFLYISRSFFHSPQFSALSVSARALVFELHAMFNGTNNGQIFLSVRDAAARLGFADFKAAMTAFSELEKFGFIQETIAGSFSVKADEVSRARAWHLNWIDAGGRCVGPDVIQPLDFTTMTPKQKRRVSARQTVLSRYLKDYQRGQFAVEESSTLSARMVAAESGTVEESRTLNEGNGGNPPSGFVRESCTHIEYHRGAGSALAKSVPTRI